MAVAAAAEEVDVVEQGEVEEADRQGVVVVAAEGEAEEDTADLHATFCSKTRNAIPLRMSEA